MWRLRHRFQVQGERWGIFHCFYPSIFDKVGTFQYLHPLYVVLLSPTLFAFDLRLRDGLVCAKWCPLYFFLYWPIDFPLSIRNYICRFCSLNSRVLLTWKCESVLLCCFLEDDLDMAYEECERQFGDPDNVLQQVSSNLKCCCYPIVVLA